MIVQPFLVVRYDEYSIRKWHLFLQFDRKKKVLRLLLQVDLVQLSLKRRLKRLHLHSNMQKDPFAIDDSANRFYSIKQCVLILVSLPIVLYLPQLGLRFDLGLTKSNLPLLMLYGCVLLQCVLPRHLFHEFLLYQSVSKEPRVH